MTVSTSPCAEMGESTVEEITGEQDVNGINRNRN